VADRHGRRARPREPGAARRGRVPATAGRPAAAIPGAHQQLHLHPPGPRRPAGPLRPQGSRRGDLDLGAGDRGVPGRPAAARLGLRHRRGRPDHRPARGRLHPDRHRPGLRRARRDPHLLLRGDHQGDPADRLRIAVHRHQPRRHRPVRRGPAAGHRLGRGADQPGDRPRALLHRQAEPDDVPQRPEPDRGALGEHRYGRRPDGHRRGRRRAWKPSWCSPAPPGSSRSTSTPTGPAGSSTRFPTSSSSSERPALLRPCSSARSRPARWRCPAVPAAPGRPDGQPSR
jgi:hypothetical protein